MSAAGRPPPRRRRSGVSGLQSACRPSVWSVEACEDQAGFGRSVRVDGVVGVPAVEGVDRRHVMAGECRGSGLGYWSMPADQLRMMKSSPSGATRKVMRIGSGSCSLQSFSPSQVTWISTA